jgi:hypothetical protein
MQLYVMENGGASEHVARPMWRQEGQQIASPVGHGAPPDTSSNSGVLNEDGA